MTVLVLRAQVRFKLENKLFWTPRFTLEHSTGMNHKVSQKFNISPSHLDWLRQEASRRECSMSQALRDILNKIIEDSKKSS